MGAELREVTFRADPNKSLGEVGAESSLTAVAASVTWFAARPDLHTKQDNKARKRRRS